MNQTTKETNKNNVTKADTKKRANWYSHRGRLWGGGLYKLCKVDEDVKLPHIQIYNKDMNHNDKIYSTENIVNNIKTTLYHNK